MLFKLCQRHGRLWQKSTVCHIQSRLLFSESDNWTGDFSKENRLKWEKYWKEKIKHQDSSTVDPGGKEKFYVLSMFPYPSGKLHMGHVRVYTISDTMARFHRMKGRHVIHPMGWDAFGLPAENAAIERQEMPDKWTYSNIETMKKQLEDLNCSLDWSREFATCDPSYYKWTQHIFLKMFERGLVYQKEAPVNWDPVDQTVLADEQVDENGRSWRSGAKVQKIFLRQWYIRTTQYLQSLHNGLSEIDTDFWRDVVSLQKNWFGPIDGVCFKFKLQVDGADTGDDLSLYTPFPGAIYGASHITVSPQHYLVHKAQQQALLPEPLMQDMLLQNVKAKHPLTEQSLPVYVSTSHNFEKSQDLIVDAIVGIPCVDEEQKQFVETHDIPHVNVIETRPDGSRILTSSKQFTGMTLEEAFNKVAELARELGMGGYRTSEKNRDWLISRQRYWGTPIPLIHCPEHGVVPVPYEDLPVTQPKLTEKLGKGNSPAAQDQDWLNVKCPRCGAPARRETETMDTFVDSSWYFLRFLDPNNDKEPFSKEVANKLMPVDLYIGGKEHATMHLYYARFFSHFLYDEGLLPTREPFVNLLTQGMVKGQSYILENSGKYLQPHEVEGKTRKLLVEKSTDEPVMKKWEKMSKSKYNGVDPQSVIDEYGCDSMRLFIMGGVSPQSDRNWDESAFKGIMKMQRKLWNQVKRLRTLGHSEGSLSKDVLAQLDESLYDTRNYTIKEVNFQMEKVYLFHTALTRISQASTSLANFPDQGVSQSFEYERLLCDLIIIMAPFAPMFASELWAGVRTMSHRCSHYNRDKDVLNQKWPVLDTDYRMEIRVQKNEKTLYTVKFPVPCGQEQGFTKEDALALAKTHPDFAYHFDEDNMHIKWILTPGANAYLSFTESKKKQKQKEAL